MAGSYIATALNFCANYVSLSILGPHYIGLYQTFVVFKNYALNANIGEVQAIRKHGAVLRARRQNAALEEYQNQTLTVSLLTVTVVVLLGSIIGFTVVKPTGFTALTFAAILVLFGIEYMEYFFGNCLAARNEFHLWTRGAVLLAAASLGLLVLVLPFGYAGFLLSKVLAATLFLFYLLRMLKYRFRPTLRVTQLRTMIKTGLTMSLIGLLSTYFVTADRLVVLNRLGTAAMGVYSLVPMMVLPLVLFVQGVSAVLFTRSSYLVGARESTRTIVEDAASFVRVTDRFVPRLVSILIFLLPVAITALLPKFRGAIAAAQVALLGYCYYGLASPFANLFIVLDRARLLIGILLFSGTVTLALGSVGVAAGWGLRGAALGSALGSVTYAMLTLYCPIRWSGVGVREGVAEVTRNIRRTIALTSIAALTLVLLRPDSERWILLSTLVAAAFALSSIPTIAWLIRECLRVVRAKDLSEPPATGSTEERIAPVTLGEGGC